MEETLHPLEQLDGHMNTFSGKKLNIIDPKIEQISIKDIAKGLAYKGYFGGQTPHYFSVAQHCLMVCDLIPQEYQQQKDIMLLALLHDASEAYLGDMIKPLKVLLPEFQKIENKLQSVIMEAFGLNPELMPLIKPYDTASQKVCYETFYKHTYSITYFPPSLAESLFLERFYKYSNL